MVDKVIVVGKSSTRATTFNISGSLSNTNDNIARDIVLDRDDRLHKFTEEEYNNLTDIYHVYRDDFADGHQFNRLHEAQKTACCLWDYVTTKLYDKLKDARRDIIANERLALADDLFRSRGTVHSIAGCTRGSFGAFIEQDTLRRFSAEMAAMQGTMDMDARKLELEGTIRAEAAVYNAKVVGEHTVFQDFALLLQALRGAEEWDETDQRTDDDTDRNTTTTTLATSWSRTVGNVSDAQTDFQAEWDDVMAAGGAA